MHGSPLLAKVFTGEGVKRTTRRAERGMGLLRDFLHALRTDAAILSYVNAPAALCSECSPRSPVSPHSSGGSCPRARGVLLSNQPALTWHTPQRLNPADLSFIKGRSGHEPGLPCKSSTTRDRESLQLDCGGFWSPLAREEPSPERSLKGSGWLKLSPHGSEDETADPMPGPASYGHMRIFD